MDFIFRGIKSYSALNGCDCIINSITSYVVWYSFETGSVETIQLKTDQRIDVSALSLRSVIKRQFIVRNCFGLAILLMLIGSLIHVPNDLHLFFFCSEPFTNPIFWTKGQGRIQMELSVRRIHFLCVTSLKKKVQIGRKNSSVFLEPALYSVFYIDIHVD